MLPSPSYAIRYAVAGRDGDVNAAHPIWNEPLPVSVRRPPDTPGPTDGVTYGDYFDAVHHYIRHEGAGHLDAALAVTRPAAPSPALTDAVEVILEKHGEFYHPARIRVAMSGHTCTLALNVATTPAGIDCMRNEINALRRVTPRLPQGALPRIYGQGHVDASNGQGFDMFMADWFDDFHEFHLSVDPVDGLPKIVVWDTRKAPFFLEPDLVTAVYRQSAYLLARAYDPLSTCQIYPWHHASGDFVLQLRKTGVAVKLITARQYAPTIGSGDGAKLDAESRLMAAVVFFANLTLRNQIDRLDGTGDLAWADDAVVAATVAGFTNAMDKASLPGLNALLQSYDAGDWEGLLRAVGGQYRLMPAEQVLLDRHIPDHAVRLRDAVHAVCLA